MAKKGFNKLHLIWIIPISVIVVIGAIFLIINLSQPETQTEAQFEGNCVNSGGEVRNTEMDPFTGAGGLTCKCGYEDSYDWIYYDENKRFTGCGDFNR